MDKPSTKQGAGESLAGHHLHLYQGSNFTIRDPQPARYLGLVLSCQPCPAYKTRADFTHNLHLTPYHAYDSLESLEELHTFITDQRRDRWPRLTAQCMVDSCNRVISLTSNMSVLALRDDAKHLAVSAKPGQYLNEALDSIIIMIV